MAKTPAGSERPDKPTPPARLMNSPSTADAAAGTAVPAPPMPQFADFSSALGLPGDFPSRSVDRSQVVAELLSLFHHELEDARFLLGLMLAFMGFIEDVLKQAGEDSIEDILAEFPPIQKTPAGRPRDNLFVEGPKTGVSLRTYYNKVEDTILNALRRFEYPRCAPHATRSWQRSRETLVALAAISPEERLAFALELWDAVLALPEFKGRAGDHLGPRPFSLLLAQFPQAVHRVPTGAILQGLAFAYYRADAPNVTLEAQRVRAGGARTGRVGDIDGWSGSNLMLAIEVKDYRLTNLSDLAGFIANLRNWPDATAIVLAKEFAGEVTDALAAQNILSLDRASMAKNVALWDVRKQQLAMREFEHFAQRIETNSKLLDAIRSFAEQQDLQF